MVIISEKKDLPELLPLALEEIAPWMREEMIKSLVFLDLVVVTASCGKGGLTDLRGPLGRSTSQG